VSTHGARFYKRRKKRGNEIGQILLNMGAIRPEQLREALRIQHETGASSARFSTAWRMQRPGDRAGAHRAGSGHREPRGTSPSLRARENPSLIGLGVHSNPGLTLALLVAADAFGLLLAGGIAQSLVVDSASLATRALGALAVTAVCIGAFAVQHLYSMSPPSPPDEIRRVSQSVSLIYVGFYAVASSSTRARSRPACDTAPGSRDGSFRSRSCRSFGADCELALRAGRGGSCHRRARGGRVGRTLVSTLQNHPSSA